MNEQVDTVVVPEFLTRLPAGTKVSPAPQADLGVTEGQEVSKEVNQ